MSAAILDGRAVAETVRVEVAEDVKRLVERHGRAPGLDVVLVGDDPASHVYVRNKERSAEKVGIRGAVHRLPAETSSSDLLALIRRLNDANEVDGILVQLPLPKSLNSLEVVDAIDPAKDVDGLHPLNAGRLAAGRDGLRPCTPSGCMRLLRESGRPLAGLRAVVVGRSNLVGKPIAQMLLAEDCTVTMAHSRTRDLGDRVREADVVIAAVGRAKMIEGSWIKEGAIVIDVGINRLDDGTLVGDVDFETAKLRASHITPVPGGVGPMTVAMLLANTVTAMRARLLA